MKKYLLIAFFALLFIPLTVGTVNAKAAKLNKTSVTVVEGKKVQLKVTGTKKKVKWKSLNTSVAGVSKKGKVTAKKPGSATIVAKFGKKKLTCKVTVESKPEPKTDTDVKPTMAQYNNVKIGMTLEKVRKLLKSDGELVRYSAFAGYTTYVYKWDNDKAELLLTFEDNKLVKKEILPIQLKEEVNNYGEESIIS